MNQCFTFTVSNKNETDKYITNIFGFIIIIYLINYKQVNFSGDGISFRLEICRKSNGNYFYVNNILLSNVYRCIEIIDSKLKDYH